MLVPCLLLTACSSAPPAGEDVGRTSTQTTVCGTPDNGVVQGVDVSHYQGTFDWAGAKGRGVEFGYASIGDGTGFADPDFGANWTNLKAAGLLRGAYQYFEPGQDPTAQANLMVQAVGMLGGGDLPCMVDVETTGGQSGATIAANVKTWLGVVKAGTGREPFVYTGPSFWDGSVGDTSLGSVPLWIADYGPPSGCPAVPNGWSGWVIWQYGDTGGTLDQDVFNGSLAQLEAYAAPPAPACTSTCTESPRVGVAGAPTGEGYWITDTRGAVYPNGNASFFGDLSGLSLAKPVVGIAATPSGQGYWLVAADGGVFNFGNAGFYGSLGGKTLNKPLVGMAATPDGAGYWLVAADGGVFNYGSAGFFGSAGSTTLNAPVVGMAATPTGKGYWLVAADGGIFNYGDAAFDGSAGGTTLNAPVVGLAPTPDGKGYWLVGADGGIFSYGDAAFQGSAGGMKLNQPVVGMSRTVDGQGYWLVAADGGLFTYGDAPYLGGALPSTCAGGIPELCVIGSNGCYSGQAGGACAAGEVCNHGTCQATCTDACTGGSSRCNGANIERCGHYGSSPCNTWSAGTACPSGQTCASGVCGSTTCSDDCEPGATECQAGSLVGCTGTKAGGCHTWGTPTACQAGQTCAPGGCVSPMDGGVTAMGDAGRAGDAGTTTDAGVDVGPKGGKDSGARVLDATPGKGGSKEAGSAGSADATAGESSASGSSCGCAIVGTPRSRGAPAGLAVLGLALRLVRRRRRSGQR